MNARKQYLQDVGKEYERADEAKRSRLLDEAVKRTGLHRKYLIRVLNHPRPAPPKRTRRRGATYSAAVITVLIQIWDIFEHPCGQRMTAVLQSEVGRLRDLGEIKCSDVVAEQLGRISSSTIDRVLQREKRVRMLKPNRNPGVHRLIHERVPVKVASEWDTSVIGNLQVDFVLHCGRFTGGDYVHTISTVDIATGWWEGRAIPVRSQHATKEGLVVIQSRLPFRILELHPDNDSALLNDLLWDWATEEKIALSRSRPYQKNDNAWVEQKNWTHVRKVVGYRRYDTTAELRLLNEIYDVLRLYKNFFLPTIRLKSKTRVKGRIHRSYEKACTPYQRLIESPQLDRATKRELEATHARLNPGELHRKLTTLREQLETRSAGKSEGVVKPSYRGPDLHLASWRNPDPAKKRLV